MKPAMMRPGLVPTTVTMLAVSQPPLLGPHAPETLRTIYKPAS